MKRIEVEPKTYIWYLLLYCGAIAFSVGFTLLALKLTHLIAPLFK